MSAKILSEHDLSRYYDRSGDFDVLVQAHKDLLAQFDRAVAQSAEDESRYFVAIAQRDEALAKLGRAREALEEISDGACISGYSGCDWECKDVARKALAETAPQELKETAESFNSAAGIKVEVASQNAASPGSTEEPGSIPGGGARHKQDDSDHEPWCSIWDVLAERPLCDCGTRKAGA